MRHPLWHEAIAQIGPRSSATAADVAVVGDIQRVIDTVARQHGRIDAIKTPLTRAAHEQPEFDAYVRAAVPMQRWGEAEEVARAVMFLASDESSYMTGSVLAVDGGMAQV